MVSAMTRLDQLKELHQLLAGRLAEFPVLKPFTEKIEVALKAIEGLDDKDEIDRAIDTAWRGWLER